MTGLSLLLAAAAFVAGVEIAKRHPANPWRYMRDEIRDALRKDPNIQEGELVDDVVDEIIDDPADGQP